MSVSAIAIGFTSAALAAGGGSVYLTQTGDDQLATITQSGGTDDRVGTSGTPFLQKNGGGDGGNTLIINQAGSQNRVNSSFQSGTANRANIEQLGNNNTATLRQTGALNGSDDIQDVHGYWSNDNDGGSILQDANDVNGKVEVTQSNSANAEYGNAFNIGQSGNTNRATVNQTGDNLVWIRQGTPNPDVWWGPLTPAGGLLSNSTIEVTQNGGHVAGPEAGTTYVNYAGIAQGNGNLNKIVISQSGDANNADINQSGSNNIFSSTQTSSNGNTAWNFVGTEGGWPDGSLDQTPIVQRGNDNEYRSIQSGTNLWAFGSQIGNDNFLSNTQSGDRQTLYTAQNGNSNTIYSVQAGDSNTATVTQNNSSSLSNTNQNGSGNTATITQ
jgi:hypothetical protein